MRQQQQEMSMNSNVTIDATAVFGMHGVGKSSVVSLRRRSKERQLTHRDRYFDGLDDG